MKLLLLQVASQSAIILFEKLTHKSIFDMYDGVNAQGVLYNNTTDYKNVVIVESTENNCVILAAYADNKVQKWFFETQTPISLARKLVHEFGVMCGSGLNDNLFA